MQIHEITRKPISERLGEGILDALGKQFGAGQLDDGPDQNQSGIGGDVARADAALKVNQQMAELLGQQLGKAWQLAVQKFMQENKDASGGPMTSLKNAKPTDAAVLRAELNKMISGASKIPGAIDAWPATINTADPGDKEKAQRVVNNLKKFEELVWKETVSPTDAQGKVRIQAFNNLGTSISQAQTLQQFFANQPERGSSTPRPGEVAVTFDSRTGRVFVNGRIYDASIPAHKAAYDAFVKAGGGTP